MDLAREPEFLLGGMRIRPSTREVVFEGGREVLEPQVMSVLVRLARGKGEVVTREDLQDACWDGRVVSDDAINRVISRIRRAADLTKGRDFTLETITKVGYRLVAGESKAVSPIQAPGAPAAPAKPKLPGPAVIGAIGLVLVAGIAALWFAFGREPDWTDDPKAPLTLAVLPFDNLGPAPDEGLATGMSREIRNTLSRVRGLRVVSDASSFAIASENLSAEQMGRRLMADYLLDGSFARSGDTVKLSAELVDAWSGVNLWTGSQSGPAADLDRLRAEMSSSVFEQLVKRIGPNRVEMLASPKPTNPQIYRLLVEAWELLESTTTARMRGRPEDGLDAGDKANALVDQALAIEPESALALRVKAQVIAMGATHELFAQEKPVAEKQADAALLLRRALASDPDNASALAALGEYYRRFEWRWEDARALLERSLALDPNSADGQLSYAYYLSGAGRCIEALDHARAAIQLDPEFGWRTLGVPRALKCAGRFEESDAAYLAAIGQDRGNLFVLREIYLNFLIRGDMAGLEKARVHVRDDLWKGAPEPEVQLWLDWTAIAIEGMRGKRGPFLEVIEKDFRANLTPDERGALDSVGRSKGDLMWIFAVEFAAAGETSRAIELLQAAVAAGALYIPETMPFGAYEFTPEMRADPRYQAIWKNDPRLVELMNLRREALEAGQMDGVLPDGRRVTVKPPAT